MLQMGKMMSAEVKWKADHISSSCQGLCSELASEQSLVCLGLCVFTGFLGSALSLAAAPSAHPHLWVPLSCVRAPWSLPTLSAALCPAPCYLCSFLIQAVPPLFPALQCSNHPSSHRLLHKIQLPCTCLLHPHWRLTFVSCIKHT